MLAAIGFEGTLSPQLPGFAVISDLVGLRPVLRAILAQKLRRPLDHADVEDGEAEVLRRAIEGRARLREGEPLRPWVIGIARYVAIDLLRQRGRAPLAEPDDQIPDSAPTPAAQLERRERARRLERALAELPAKQRQALLLFHGEGLDYRTIAERLDVPIGTVCTWIARARQTLARVLREDAPRLEETS